MALPRHPLLLPNAQNIEGATITEPEQPETSHTSGQQAVRSTRHPDPIHQPSRGASAQRKPSTHIHRLMKVDLNANQQLVKTAFTTHLRILWGAQNANAILPHPPAAQLQAFRTRFTSSNEIAAAFRSPRLIIDKSLVRDIRDYSSQNLGGRKTATESLEEDILDYMQTYCAEYGLYVWSLKLSESPYTIYNSACRLVAVTTFKHALSMDSYAFVEVDTTAATDIEVLIRIHDHFNARQRESESLSRRYQMLARDLKANSDDEPDPLDGYAYRLLLPGFFNDLSDASTVALYPDPSQILSNGRKHPDEMLTDKDFFDKFAEGILVQYRKPRFGDDQEEMSSQDGYEAESNHSVDTESIEGSMANDAITT
ncbi:hypothetical protein P389DRAFT_191778 [Cystobasidium minutum MCA 4210]|uniref:uncharacterized protein n=1 Tax=Cystobasidium minutum MCA 4210 TaxID=1397322 RepID=UPI0034CF6DAF|eukprot:jgi/Rhomi1/191778/estExt_fgenesh1_pg.C_150002